MKKSNYIAETVKNLLVNSPVEKCQVQIAQENDIAAKTTRFEEGNIYEMRFIGDSDLKPQFICLKRTAKTATFQRFQSTEKAFTRKIKTYNNSEYIVDGSYSMAPSINSNKVVG
jgi:hypothetical protein